MQGSTRARAHNAAPRPQLTLNTPNPTPAAPNGPELPTVKQASDISLLGGRGHGEPQPEQSSCKGTRCPSLAAATPQVAPSKPREVLKRTVRRRQLREMVPLADTTIYEMEQRGEFPRRFYLTPRCAVWDASEVEAWIEGRRRASNAQLIELSPRPDVRKRLSRPVKR
jgi:prophage regulatory protein